MNDSLPTIKVPFHDLSRKITKHEDGIRQALERVLNSGNLILSDEVVTFELEFADYLGAKHCVGTANGTDSIEIALKAAGVGLGSKVATCANAGFYSSTAISCIGAEPVFMDVEIDSRNISIESVELAIEQGAKYVIATHLYGMAIKDIFEISKYCEEKGVFLIEDCAQAHGARISGKKVGTFGGISTFSFYPTKNLGALGDAGAIVTNSSDLFSRLLKLRTYGWGEKYRVEISGGRNSRLDEVQAAVLRALLPHLDAENEKRLEIANFYNDNIVHQEMGKPIWEKGQYVGHIYAVTSAFRGKYLDKLMKSGVGHAIHYPIPDYRQMSNSRIVRGMINSDLLAESIFSLPCYPELTLAEMELVVETINSI